VKSQTRCSWCGDEPIYVAYHDTEWGVPETDSRALFEKLLLDGFQAGLSWLIVLKKREGFRRAFDGFDPARIALYDTKKLAALMQDAGIVRNRAKIEASVLNARAYLELTSAEGSFARFLWSYVDGRPIDARLQRLTQMPTESAQSRALSKELKRRGFKFCGPTIVYAFMQAVGMVNDHLVVCHRHREVVRLSKALQF